METVKSCTTCRHVLLNTDEGPCNRCQTFGVERPTKWEPHPDDAQKAPGVGHALGAGKGERQTFPLSGEQLNAIGAEVLKTYRENPPKISSTGGSTSYYKLPEGATDLQDLIEHKDMSFGRGNIFKAAYRLGEKDAATETYDLRKIIWFAQRRLAELGEDA